MTMRQGKPSLALDYSSGYATTALAACRAYVSGAQAYLRDEALLPDPSAVLAARFHAQCLTARPLREGEEVEALGANTWAIATDMMHPDTNTNASRYYDHSYFTGMKVMELAGGIFTLEWSKRREYTYVIYSEPTTNAERHRATRLIADPPAFNDVRYLLPRLQHGYRFYLRDMLRIISKRAVRASGHKARSISLVREDALRYVVRLFAERAEEAGTWLGLTVPEYEQLLRMTFDTADAIHTKHQQQQAVGKEA